MARRWWSTGAWPRSSATPESPRPRRHLRPPSASGSSETLPGSAIGTPAFMSPEQAAGRLDQLGPASDVYSLGATLYCLLTGQAPFEERDIDGRTARRSQRGEFRPPRQLKPDVPRALEAICLKAMAAKPEDRYPTPRALADDMERWLADEPVSAWREPFSVRARRWMRRHRTAVTGAAVALLAGLIGLAAVAVVQTRANDRLIKANAATTMAKNEACGGTGRDDQGEEGDRRGAGTVGGVPEAGRGRQRFLVERSAAPTRGRTAGTIKVVDVLDRAAEKLDEEFKVARIQGALLDALGADVPRPRASSTEPRTCIVELAPCAELRSAPTIPTRSPAATILRGLPDAGRTRRRDQDARGDPQARGVEARPRPPRHAHQPQQPRQPTRPPAASPRRSDCTRRPSS